MYVIIEVPYDFHYFVGDLKSFSRMLHEIFRCNYEKFVVEECLRDIFKVNINTIVIFHV